MSLSIRLFAAVFLVLLVGGECSVTADDQESSRDADSKKEKATLNELANAAIEAQKKGNHAAAIAAANGLMSHPDKSAAAVRLAGDVYLRAGESRKAVKCFDEYLESNPNEMPYLWQRGIALYFIGEFQKGVKQFEEHRHVNPNDVENAAWHFLCLSKADSFAKAEKQVLPAPGDSRVPMDEVLQMLRSGKTEVVTRRIDAVPEGTPLRDSAEFYGYFYLGLYADAKGDSKTALEEMRRSAKKAPRNYMGDVARVYADYLKDQVEKRRSAK